MQIKDSLGDIMQGVLRQVMLRLDSMATQTLRRPSRGEIPSYKDRLWRRRLYAAELLQVVTGARWTFREGEDCLRNSRRRLSSNDRLPLRRLGKPESQFVKLVCSILCQIHPPFITGLCSPAIRIFILPYYLNVFT